MRGMLIIALVFAGIQHGQAQPKYVGFRIDSAVRTAVAERQIPGLQMLVVKYGLVIKKANYGFSNLEDRVAVTDSTIFSIASMSKAMTCAAILLLMEDGKLGIDDSIGKYLDSLPVSWKTITIHQLMNHTAGLVDDWREDDQYFNSKTTDSNFLHSVEAMPLVFQPGQAMNYSCGPFVLGMLVSRISGISYAAFMKERIFDKLGMKNSSVNNREEIIPNRAAGYLLKAGKIMHGRQISGAAQARGDVGVLSTASDMLKWRNALMDSSLLRRSSLELMFSAGKLSSGLTTSYGLGWFLSPYRNHALIAHNGGFRTGFSSSIEIYPEDGLFIIILCNLYNAHTTSVCRTILGLFDQDYGPASKMPVADDPDSVRSLMLKNFYSGLGVNLDSCRKTIQDLHIPFYPLGEEDLLPFRNIETFRFIKAIEPLKPRKDIFGDVIQGIYLYDVKCSHQPVKYYAFFLNPEGKPVYMDYEE